jgi:SAM-dependent methyltransferase
LSALNDPQAVREQYASETGLAARSALYEETTGPYAGDVALEAVAEISPRTVLDVGCGTGWFGARVRDELGVDVVAADQSERMVDLARERGLDARVADVQTLPFSDASFDAVAANWMLYHVPDLDRGLAEIARVLTRGGRLVAVTVGRDNLLELWRLVGAETLRLNRPLSFATENGAEALSRHFARIDVRDASGTVRITSPDAVRRYVQSTEVGRPLAGRVPEHFDAFDARRSNVVFVADK